MTKISDTLAPIEIRKDSQIILTLEKKQVYIIDNVCERTPKEKSNFEQYVLFAGGAEFPCQKFLPVRVGIGVCDRLHCDYLHCDYLHWLLQLKKLEGLDLNFAH